MEHRPVSFAEERFWLAEHQPARCVAFVECPHPMASFVRIQGALDEAALAASLDDVARRHDVLRSSFAWANGRVTCRVHAPAGLPLAFITLPGLDVGHARVQAALAAELARPFDVANGPLARAHLLRLGPEDAVLAVVIHHLVFDGWSLHVLWRELQALYAAHVDAQPERLPPPPRRYVDYVTWQRERLQGPRLAMLLDYWQQRLAGLEDLHLPTDTGCADRVSTHAARERFALEPTRVESLRKLCRDLGITMGVVFATALAVLLHELTGALDVAIGVPVADRNRPEFEGLIGALLNLVVLRVDLAREPTFVELLERVRRSFVGAYDHRELPHGCLSGLHGLPGELSLAPVRVVLNFVSSREETPTLLGLKATRLHVDGHPPSCADLSLHLFDRAGALSGFVLYKRDLFAVERVQRWVSRFMGILDELMAGPGQRVAERQGAWS